MRYMARGLSPERPRSLLRAAPHYSPQLNQKAANWMSRKFSSRNENGQTMVEFTLVLPILCVVLFGVIQMGILFHDYITLTDATRAGARVAAVSSQDPNRVSKVSAAVKNSAQNLDQAQISPSVSSTWAHGADVTVTATYPYSVSLLGFVVRSGLLSSATTERVE